MKNLKRVLSLVLATVMVIGMMVVGASAADYKDADKIDYTEAVDVMSAVGMIEGYAGNFGPEGKIDRAGATKLITYLMLGTDVASKLTVSEAPFEDVPANAWYAPFVAFCAEKGLLEGYNGKFYPNEPINAYGFAKLLLGALGYRADIENLTGDTWQVNVATLAIQNGLFNGNDGAFANQDMTRQEACLYAFNALKAVTVGYTGGTNVTLPGGATVTTGATRYEVTNADKTVDYRYNTAADLAKADDKVQLCEYLYEDLKISNTPDAYGRPGNTWTYGTDGVVAFAGKTAYATYDAADFSQDVMDDLVADNKINGKALYPVTLNTYALLNVDGDMAHYDGADNVTYDKLMAGSLTGATVELYVSNKNVTNIVVVQPYVATISNISTSKATGETTVTVKNLSWAIHDWTAGEAASPVGAKTITISSKANKAAYEMVKDFAKDDVFAAVVTGNHFWDSVADLKAVNEVETVSGKITAKNFTDGWVKVDGVQYPLARAYSGAEVTVGDTGTFYLYNGYVLHYAVEQAADTTAKAGYALRGRTNSDWGTPTYEVEMLFADGHVEVVEVDSTTYGIVTTWGPAFAYSKTNGVYSATGYAAFEGDLLLKKNLSKVTGTYNTFYTDSKTTFVILNMKDGAFDHADVYNGVAELPNMHVANVRPIMRDANFADVVFCTYGAAESATAEDLIYVAKDSVSGKITDADLGDYYTYTAIVEGKIVQIKANATGYDGLYKSATIDENGIYSFVAGDKAVDGTDAELGETSFGMASNGTVKIGSEYLTFVKDVPVYLINKGAVSEIGADYSDYTSVNVGYTVKDNMVTSIYITIYKV